MSGYVLKLIVVNCANTKDIYKCCAKRILLTQTFKEKTT